jgi:Coenzyme PQQ synthesis protein D (PqqD)
VSVPRRWRQGAEVAARRVDDRVVLVNLQTNYIYALNATGSRLWELLDVARSRDELVAELLAEFELERAALERETDSLLADLEKASLVTGEN